MNPVIEVASAAKEEEFTTYISANLEKLYERAFLSNYEQTAAAWNYPQEVSSRQFVVWKAGSLPVQSPSGYDPTIIRLYEEIIAELQRELAGYKELVRQLLYRRQLETEDLYPRGEITVLPAEVAEKLRTKTLPGQPLVDYEI